ncbi:DUF5009 domain-containing protein [Echinicola strongylocentroti]|uniref:DUF5009 domain-containing protein n=2 Tax=Echinicola strongylocentroti TaxID=1795355 RepID=A0A2Z4ILY0_9BACT|nr:DUF5009 domain-containing protein [Echinicola strongylocentroti]
MPKMNPSSQQRLLSLDFYRGITMFLLIAEFSHLFSYLVSPEFEGTFVYALGEQFHHVEWEGLHFWDLIQPFFMFIVGVAMPMSFAKRMEKGANYSEVSQHAYKRAFVLLVLGWGLYCIDPGEIVFKFQNVLAQLAVTYLLAFLVMRKTVAFQIAFSLLLLLVSELLYRFFPVEGFDHAFQAGENFGAWFNVLIAGEEDSGHWAMFNALPTAAHTIWGVCAGKLLIGPLSGKRKWRLLLVGGLVALFLGYALSTFTPIIKRIATSSFVIISGGWSLIALAICYWWIDVRKHQKGVWVFAIVGMNPLFIYLFAHVGGADLVRKILLPFSNATFGWTGELGAGLVLSLLVLLAMWYICFWLYKRKIFFKV